MKDEKKKKNSKLKVALNIFLFFLAIVLVLYFSLKDNFKEVVDVIFTMNPIFIIIALLLMLGYRLLSGYSLYIIVTGNYSSIMTSKAKEIGILGVIKKPILDDKKLISQIKEALK